jgi:hypothetical protein
MHRLWLLTLSAAVAIAGCNNKAPSIKTYPVTGTVTYNGKPVVGATVAYVSKSVEAPRCTGVTDTEGRFSLVTYVGANEILKGAAPGDYSVAITKTVAGSGGGSAGNNMDTMSDLERQQAMQKMWQQQKATETRPKDEKPKSEIPEKYGKPETSLLSATVVVGDNEPREFKLTDE